MPYEFDEIWFELDHIIALSHGGLTAAENLALACFFCNNRKGTNLAGIDPLSHNLVPIFNPRRQVWKRHFGFNGPIVVGRTKSGRATVAVLELNLQARVDLRKELIASGLFP